MKNYLSANTMVLPLVALAAIATGANPLPVGYHDMFQSFSVSVLALSFIFAFMLAFAVGANDSANSFGCSVGSQSMSFRTACFVGAIAETLGAVFLSGNVIKKITQGIIDINMYQSDYNNVTDTWDPAPPRLLFPEAEEMIGSTSVLLGSGLWQIFASSFALPVSGTHSIIGALLGFHFVARGFKGVKWWTLGKIVISWVASPVLSGIMSAIIYYPIRRWVIMPSNSLKYGNYLYPVFWGFVGFLNIGIIFTTGSTFEDLFGQPEGTMWGIAAGIGVFIGIVVAILQFVKIIKLEPQGENYRQCGNVENFSNIPCCMGDINKGCTVCCEDPESEEEDEERRRPKDDTPAKDDDDHACRNMFVSLQWMGAISGALAHGGNDVGNCIGPLVTVWLIYRDPTDFVKKEAPWYLLVYGGFGIAVGLFVLGHRVIKTIGSDLTTMTPSRGAVSDFSAAVIVLIANKLGIPVSTTHCQVGAVMAVGIVRGLRRLDWRLFGKIAVSWVVTIPAAGGTAALCYCVLYYVYFIIVGYNNNELWTHLYRV